MKKIIVLTLFLNFSSLNFSQTNNENHFTFLSIGDSYTIGESVAEAESFPVQLADTLRNSGYKIEAPLIIAKTGWTTDELFAALDEKEPIGKFDFVTLLIGVNNQYRGRDAEEFRNKFVQLLNRAAGYSYSIKSVIVVSIPDWGVTPFAISKGKDQEKVSEEIDLYNSIKKEETEKAGAHFVYITDISKKAQDDETLLAEDGLHPSGKMYSLWVERILSVAEKIIINKNK